MVSEGGRAQARIDPDEEYAGPRPDVIGQAPRALPRFLAVDRVRMIRHATPPATMEIATAARAAAAAHLKTSCFPGSEKPSGSLSLYRASGFCQRESSPPGRRLARGSGVAEGEISGRNGIAASRLMS